MAKLTLKEALYSKPDYTILKDLKTERTDGGGLNTLTSMEWVRQNRESLCLTLTQSDLSKLEEGVQALNEFPNVEWANLDGTVVRIRTKEVPSNSITTEFLIECDFAPDAHKDYLDPKQRGELYHGLERHKYYYGPPSLRVDWSRCVEHPYVSQSRAVNISRAIGQARVLDGPQLKTYQKYYMCLGGGVWSFQYQKLRQELDVQGLLTMVLHYMNQGPYYPTPISKLNIIHHELPERLIDVSFDRVPSSDEG